MHIYICIYISKTMRSHQFQPFESNSPEFILELHFSIFAFPFFDNQKCGPYYPQHIYLFTQFPRIGLISWSPRLSQLWLCWACLLYLLGTLPWPRPTWLNWPPNLLCDPGPFARISARQWEQQVEFWAMCRALCGARAHEKEGCVRAGGQRFSNWGSWSPRGSCRLQGRGGQLWRSKEFGSGLGPVWAGVSSSNLHFLQRLWQSCEYVRGRGKQVGGGLRLKAETN